MLRHSSDNTLAYHRTRDDVDKVWIDDTATVVADVLLDGSVISGGGNINCSYVAGSQGLFLGNLPHTADLVKGKQYNIRFTITRGAFQTVDDDLMEVCR